MEHSKASQLGLSDDLFGGYSQQNHHNPNAASAA